MTTTALATGREQPKDFRKWLRPDRLMAAETRQTIDAYIAALRTTEIPTRYPLIIRQLLYRANKTAPDLTMDDYAAYVQYVATERSAQDSTLDQTIAALRYQMRLNGMGHLASALARPESTAITPERSPLTPEQDAILSGCDDYFNRMTARRRTTDTIAHTRSVLRIAIQATNRHPRTWTTNDATTILTDWNRRGIKGQTVNVRVHILRAILRHYRNFDKENPESPFADFAHAAVEPPFRQWPNPAQIDAILCETAKDRRPWAQTGMFLLSFTCLRRATTAHLRMENVNWETNRITTRTKGGKTVTIPLNPPYLRPILLAAAENSPDGRLLYRDDNSTISPDSLYDLCRATTRRATGVAFRPHDLRRGMARWIYYASGKDLILTRDFLGHEDTKMTEKYLGLSADEMQTKYEDILPKLALPGLNKLALPATQPALQSGPLNIPPSPPSGTSTDTPTP